MGITPHFWMEYPAYPEENKLEGKSLTFELDGPPLHKGDNSITVSLVSANGDAGRTVTLNYVELDVVYRQ